MSDPNTTCKICHKKLASGGVIYVTFCQHIFHNSCFKKWVVHEINCPTCQRKFDLENESFLELFDQEEKSQTKVTDQTTSLSAKEPDVLSHDAIKKNLQTSEQSKQEHEQKITNLKQSIQELSIETKEQKPKELDLKNIDNTKQNTNTLQSDDDNIVSSESVLKNQIKILEQKLQHLSEELDKEILFATSTVEKLKAEGYTNIHTDNYLVIEYFPVNQVLNPLENTIIYVGAKMHLNVCPNDIFKVRVLEKSEWQHTSTEQIALLVEFKSNLNKIKFLANKHILNNYLSPSYTFKMLEDDVSSLFIYANEKLKNCGGFKTICKNMSVNAVDNEGGSYSLHSRLDVDKLLERYINEKTFNALMAEKGLQKHQTTN